MTILHFDCFSGAAGDMVLGALLDAGAPSEAVWSSLDALGLDGVTVEVTEVRTAGLRATRATVTVTDPEPSRSFRDVLAVVERAPLDGAVKRRALETFHALGEAEARVHGVPIDELHLHEAGATDAIADVVGSCAAIQHFHPSAITASAIATGTGTITSDHGEIPLPAPAVVELLTGAVLYGRGSDELVTPTGAALLAANCDSFGALPPMRVTSSGYGAGARVTAMPNVVRVLVGTPVEDAATLLIETNLDDMNPELFPYVIERLLEVGAMDAWLTPIVMKKGRPAFTLAALCDEAIKSAVVHIFLTETTTLGVRVRPVAKEALEREWIDVVVEGEPVRVKVGHDPSGGTTVAPEFEDAKAAARASGRPLKEIYALAVDAARATSGSR